MNQTVDIKELNERIRQESSFVDLLTIEMNKVIVGQKHLVESLLTALLADGHWLLPLTQSSAVFSLLPTYCLPT